VLGDVLFPAADHRRTTGSLLAWWERRRLTFNVMVGGAGLITLFFVYLISFIPPSARIPLDWRPIAAYAVLANICYSFGWAVEAVAQRIWGDKCPRFGPALFRQGLVFSMGLTLLPILLMSFTWVVRAAMWIFLG
jgi:hypothetical protein